ncbi:MAG: hypothetical protein PVJ57_11090 [Phycisphaerae bacterium]|jgi:hypothetical protein
MKRIGTRRCALPIIAVCALLLAAPIALGRADSPPPSPWCPEVAEALDLYRTGEYGAAQRLCARLASSVDERVRRDAVAVHALTMLRMPARNDRLQGRAELAQVAREDATIAARPECNLAMGIACTELAETAHALAFLEDAAAGFAALHEPQRQAAALAALAEAWSRHTEWEVTPPRFNVKRPPDAAHAREIRREQMGLVRDRLAALPDNEDALACVDLLLAQDFIAAGDRVADGIRVLEQLAGSLQLTPAVLDACFALAGHLEREQRWADVLPLYRRIEAEAPAAFAEQAAERLREITRPQVQLAVPADAAPGQPVSLKLQTRNLDAVDVEVRRVDLAEWLTSRQGRYAPALLPQAGSVQFAQRLDTHADPYAFWEPTAPLTFTAEPGAYAVTVQPNSPTEEVRPLRRLVVVGDLTAVALAGPHEMLVWAGPRESAAGDLDLTGMKLSFWMHGSFVPLEQTFTDGFARFALPPESRVLREKRWVCLVQVGEHLALCRGDVPTAEEAGGVATVALAGGPPAPDLGDDFCVSGLLLPERSPQTGHDDEPYRLVVLDTHDRELYSTPLDPLATGVFSTKVPITADLVDQHVHMLVRRGGQTVNSLRGRFGCRTARPGVHVPLVNCYVPPHLPPNVRVLPVQVQAWYPWGTPVSGALVTCLTRALDLGGVARGEAHATNATIHEAELDESGLAFVDVPLDAWFLPAGPRAFGVQAIVNGHDGERTSGLGQTLLADEPVFSWLTWRPDEPCVGQDVRFDLGWYDPLDQVGVAPPQLQIAAADETPVELSLHAAPGGTVSEPWSPDRAGTYRVEASIPRLDGEPLHVVRDVHVAPAESVAGDPGALHCRAWLSERDGTPGVALYVETNQPRQLIAVVEAGDPLVGCVLPAAGTTSEAFLPLAAAPVGAQVVLVGERGGAPVVVARQVVEPDPAWAITLHVERVAGEPPLPGNTVDVRVRCTRAGRPATDATIVARLVPAMDRGYEPWLAGEGRALLDESTAGPVVRFSSTPERAADAPPEPAGGGLPLLSPLLTEALFAGTTVWTTAQPAPGGETTLSVPMPPAPGAYRLVVLALPQRGPAAMEELDLDTRGGLFLLADSPNRWTLGDRTRVSLLLESVAKTPSDVRVHLDVGTGLHVESVRIGDEALQSGDILQAEEGVAVTVPAHGRLWMRLDAEAMQEGVSVMQAWVEVGSSTQQATADYSVLTPGTVPPEGASLRVERSLMLLTPVMIHVDPVTFEETDALDAPEKQIWRRSPLPFGTLLAPGQRVLVREQITPTTPLAGVAWTQRVPSNCCPAFRNVSCRNEIGALRERTVDTVRYERPAPLSNVEVHEYNVVMVRPGVCRLPAPEVTAGGRPVSCKLVPAEVFFRVSEAP